MNINVYQLIVHSNSLLQTKRINTLLSQMKDISEGTTPVISDPNNQSDDP